MKILGITPKSGTALESVHLFRHSQAAGEAFQNALQSTTTTTAAAHEVANGENLSGIVRAQLLKSGQAPSNHDVYLAVDRVARANGMSNPDVLQVGQKIDLSVLQLPVEQPLPVQQGGPELAQRPITDFIIDSSTTARAGIAQRLQQLFHKKEAVTNTATSALVLPVKDAEVSSQFGVRTDPFTGRLDFHSGLDLAAKSGAEIHPIKSGQVTFSGWQSGYGRVVVVKHDDGTESMYAHNSVNLVTVGQQVDADTVIGKVGSTGRSTGPHLHLEVRLRGAAVNPSPYLNAAKILLANNKVAH